MRGLVMNSRNSSAAAQHASRHVETTDFLNGSSVSFPTIRGPSRPSYSDHFYLCHSGDAGRGKFLWSFPTRGVES